MKTCNFCNWKTVFCSRSHLDNSWHEEKSQTSGCIWIYSELSFNYFCSFYSLLQFHCKKTLQFLINAAMNLDIVGQNNPRNCWIPAIDTFYPQFVNLFCNKISEVFNDSSHLKSSLKGALWRFRPLYLQSNASRSTWMQQQRWGRRRRNQYRKYKKTPEGVLKYH